MKIKFDGWSEHAWYPSGPDLECEEEYPHARKYDGGRAFSGRGQIFVSKGAKWRHALYWHERGHCLLFEAGKHKQLVSTNQEEIWADAIAELMTSTRQVLGMLVMVLKRIPHNRVHEIVQRIHAIVERHPKESLKILEKMPAHPRLAVVVEPLKERYYGTL